MRWSIDCFPFPSRTPPTSVLRSSLWLEHLPLRELPGSIFQLLQALAHTSLSGECSLSTPEMRHPQLWLALALIPALFFSIVLIAVCYTIYFIFQFIMCFFSAEGKHICFVIYLQILKQCTAYSNTIRIFLMDE